MLDIEDLHVEVDGKEILHGIDLRVPPGEVHAVMGPNGSGKSTLAYTLAGREGYAVTRGRVLFQGHDLTAMKPEERAQEGVFLAFQYPVGFSGGEKKRNEIFQMWMLDPRLAILDETDSGLDIDALKIVAEGVNALRGPGRATLLITHYQRLLDYVVPDKVHVLAVGRIIKSGGKELALELEARGYADLVKAA